MLVETEKPLNRNAVSLTLQGSEITQVTINRPTGGGPHGGGTQTEVVTQTAVFLNQSVPLTVNTPMIGPGLVRLPFSTTIPAEATPSLGTAELARSRGRVFGRPNGCFVEYQLEGRIDVPWWLDPIDREVVPMFSPRRVLGAVPGIRSPSGGARPSLSLDVDQSAILPGQPLTGSFEILNPEGKHLRSLTLGLQRYIEYTAKGHPGSSFGPQFTTTLALTTSDTTRAGRFELQVPNTAEATGPWTGSLFRTYWNFSVALDIALGFDVKIIEPLMPV
jgi:hypothetical protein